MDPAETHVFISYSRQDSDVVNPLVQLLRAVGASVFLDKDSIRPGRKWRLVIEESIEAAQVILIFWCVHSKESVEARREWERAIAESKDVVPVLLDNQSLDESLTPYQYIDLCGSCVHRNDVVAARSPAGALGPFLRYSMKRLAHWAGMIDQRPDYPPSEPDFEQLKAAKAIALALEERYARSRPS